MQVGLLSYLYICDGDPLSSRDKVFLKHLFLCERVIELDVAIIHKVTLACLTSSTSMTVACAIHGENVFRENRINVKRCNLDYKYQDAEK